MDKLIRYSQFDAELLGNKLRELYELKDFISCRFFDMGMNDIYRIETGDDVLYYRISLAGMHQQCDYEQEVQAILTFAQAGVRVAKPVPMNDGTYVLRLEAPEGTRYGVLFEEAKQNPGGDACVRLKTLGENLARIHQISDQEQIKISREEIDLKALCEQPLQRIEEHLKHRIADYEYLTKASEQLVEFIQTRLKKEAPFYGFCHGDLHSGNVHFDGETPVIFDFDCMGYGYRAYDICIYAWNESYSNPDYLNSREWASFLAGYESIRKLTPEEKELIEPFMALRQIWLMGLHAVVMKKNAGCCWYNDGYFDEQTGLFKRFSKIAE